MEPPGFFGVAPDATKSAASTSDPWLGKEGLELPEALSVALTRLGLSENLELQPQRGFRLPAKAKEKDAKDAKEPKEKDKDGLSGRFIQLDAWAGLSLNLATRLVYPRTPRRRKRRRKKTTSLSWKSWASRSIETGHLRFEIWTQQFPEFALKAPSEQPWGCDLLQHEVWSGWYGSVVDPLDRCWLPNHCAHHSFSAGVEEPPFRVKLGDCYITPAAAHVNCFRMPFHPLFSL